MVRCAMGLENCAIIHNHMGIMRTKHVLRMTAVQKQKQLQRNPKRKWTKEDGGSIHAKIGKR